MNDQAIDFNNLYRQIDIEKCSHLRNVINTSKDKDEMRDSLRLLLENQPLLNFCFGPGDILWRGRICPDENGCLDEKGRSHTDQLFCPPIEYAKTAGRLNNPYDPMLYLSFRKFAVLAEIDAHPNDYVHLVAYGLKKHKQIRSSVVGELVRFYRSGISLLSGLGSTIDKILNEKFEYDNATNILYVDALSASILNMDREVAKKEEYFRSRILSDLIFSRVDVVKSLIYPSVASGDCINIAIKPNIARENLKIVRSEIVQVIDKFDFGFYRFRKIKDCIDINPDDTFCWGEAVSNRHGTLLNMDI
jgi:hypothetical protein